MVPCTRAYCFQLVSFLAYGASVTHGFHFDDYSLLHGPVWAAWQTRPLTWISFVANARIGEHPALWHLVNVGHAPRGGAVAV